MLGFGLSIEPQLWALVFVMVRIGAAFIAAPVFGAVSVPLPVRVALSGAIGVLVLAVASDRAAAADLRGSPRSSRVAAEALVGLALGFVLQIAFAAPMIAGEVIGTSMGLGFASRDRSAERPLDPGARPVPLGAADAAVPVGRRPPRARRHAGAEL